MKLAGSDKWPRLSETLPHPRRLDTCQACGKVGRLGPRLNDKLVSETPTGMHRWEEHDASDHGTGVVVVLCEGCSGRIVEPHPRLYRSLGGCEPMPGAMDVCRGCLWERGLGCAHPDARMNGGPGVRVTVKEPVRALVDGTRNGRRWGGPMLLYLEPASACAGKNEVVTRESEQC